ELVDNGPKVVGRSVRTPVEDEMRRSGITGELYRRRRDEDTGRADARLADERHAVDRVPAFVLRRRFELAYGAHLRRREEVLVLERREGTGSFERTLDDVDLCLRQRRVEKDAASGEP